MIYREVVGEVTNEFEGTVEEIQQFLSAKPQTAEHRMVFEFGVGKGVSFSTSNKAGVYLKQNPLIFDALKKTLFDVRNNV